MVKRRRNIEEVKSVIGKYLRSGLSKREYCKQRGISFNTLQWLHTRLKRHEKSKKNNNKVIKSGFTCFELKKPVEEKPITVSYGKVRIELPENFSEQSFRKILTTVKKCHV